MCLHFNVPHLIFERDGFPQLDEGEVDGVDPAPFPGVPLLHEVCRLLAVRYVLVATLLLLAIVVVVILMLTSQAVVVVVIVAVAGLGLS